MPSRTPSHIAFDGDLAIAEGDLEMVAVGCLAYLAAKPTATLLVLDLGSGSTVDLDLRGSAADVLARLRQGAGYPQPNRRIPIPSARGRPKLGVVSREVTLLPRHWEWLAQQQGGASATLRRLVEDAKTRSTTADAKRRRQEAAYKGITTLAGDQPGYEDAIRALFADNEAALNAVVEQWPPDVVRAIGLLLAENLEPDREP